MGSASRGRWQTAKTGSVAYLVMVTKHAGWHLPALRDLPSPWPREISKTICSMENFYGYSRKKSSRVENSSRYGRNWLALALGKWKGGCGLAELGPAAESAATQEPTRR